jgi:oryzin
LVFPRVGVNGYQGISLFAPGEDTLSTWIGSDKATYVTNGTSMAAPHVAGAVLYLQRLKGLSTPDAGKARLEELAMKDVVQGAQNSPNRLLYTGAA